MRVCRVFGRPKNGAEKVNTMVVRVIFAAGRVCNPADITIPVTMLTLTAIVLTNTVTVLTLTLIEITRSATVLTLTVIVVVNPVAVLTLTIIVLTLSSIKMTVTRQNLPVWGTAKGMKMPDSPLAATRPAIAFM
jgi:hypothetical protein